MSNGFVGAFVGLPLLLVPVVFSHVAVLFGWHVDFSFFGNYAGPKAAIFAFFSTALLVGILAFRKGWLAFRSSDAVFLGILTADTGWFLLSGSAFPEAFFGLPPSYAGIAAAFSLWAWHFSLRSVSRAEWEFARKWLLFSIVPVAAYAFVQWAGYDPIRTYSTSFGSDRAFSMLGNPNSLAFFVLLAFVWLERSVSNPIVRIGFWLVVGLVVAASRSFSGAIFFVLYAVYSAYVQRIFLKKISLGIGVVAMASALLIASGLFVFLQKEFSLLSRFELVKQGFSVLHDHSESLLFGTDPVRFVDRVSHGRREPLRALVPETVPIADLHTFAIDAIVRFGLPFVGMLAIFVVGTWKRSSRTKKETLVAFLFLSALHFPGITEWMAVLFLLSEPSGWRPVSSIPEPSERSFLEPSER